MAPVTLFLTDVCVQVQGWCGAAAFQGPHLAGPQCLHARLYEMLLFSAPETLVLPVPVGSIIVAHSSILQAHLLYKWVQDTSKTPGKSQ